MKTLTQLLCFLSFSVSLSAQQYMLIDFSTDTNLIEIDTTNPNNVWQIGKPQKPFLNSALSGDYAIITDTINSYPANNASSFILKVPKDLTDFVSGGFTGEMHIVFSTKYQMDSLLDYGRIEFSADSGDTWQIMSGDFTDTTFAVWHSGWDVWTNGTSGWSFDDKDLYTGQSAGWVEQRIRLLICSIGHPKQSSSTIIGCYPKSLWLKFVFISDSISNSLDGWAIDDIWIQTIFYVGMQETGETVFNFFPNPASDKVSLSLPQESSIKSISIRDIIGNVVYSKQTNENNLNVSISKMPNGVYYLTVGLSESSKVYSRKLVIIH